MPADKAFQDRITRIEKGKTWAPGGVIHSQKARPEKRQRRAGGGAGLLLGIALTAPVIALVLGPENLPEPIAAYVEAPAADAALARLAEIQIIGAIIGP